jgi:hypothetical protein
MHIGMYSGQRRWPDDASLGIEVPEAVDAIWHHNGDANFTRLKAALDVLLRCFQRSFYTHRIPFWPAPVVR